MNRIVETAGDLERLICLLREMKRPFTVKVTKGRNRSLEQNSLQWKWYSEAADQLQDETADQKRAYCKLHFAVPMLRAESEEYREAYDRIIKPLDYEQKLALMATPLDYPATSLLTTRQMTQYLDQVYQHFFAQGVQLTSPEPI